MIFNCDLCTMSLPNKFSMQLHAPFSPRNDAQHLVRPMASLAKTAISSNLLHWHHSIQALGIASTSNMWEDTTLSPDNDSFCWECEITFSRKVNRGKTSLSANNDLKPGSCLVLDLQKNTSKYSLNRTTHFPFFYRSPMLLHDSLHYLAYPKCLLQQYLSVYSIIQLGSNPILLSTLRMSKKFTPMLDPLS